jgi:hypothetical protein
MTHWTETEYPVAPWDTPGLPPRRLRERCANHTGCAYRDDDPARCEWCHRRWDLPSAGCRNRDRHAAPSGEENSSPPARLRVGQQVRIQRDETRYPSKGSWPRFRGRIGTIVEINGDEYGVVFTAVTPRTGRRGSFDYDSTSVAWFKGYEITQKGSE